MDIISVKTWPVKEPPGPSKKMSDIGFRAERVGDVKIKKYNVNDPSVPCHRTLLEHGIPIAQILSEDVENNLIVKKTRWIEGTNFDELKKANKLTADDWRSFGEFFAKMNNLGITSSDLVYRNILRKDDGTVIICDLAKLYESTFPEEPLIRYVLNNIYYPNEWKLALIEGYNKHREMTIKGLLDKEIAVNYDGYQDLYLNDELIKKGVRSNKRLSMIKDNFGGKDVLDIGCSSGMISRFAAKSGAHAVMAVEKLSRSGTRNMVDLAAYVSYLEGLNIQYLCCDCEHVNFTARAVKTKWHYIFFLAMLGHLKGDREDYVKWLASMTKVLYFETNLGANKVQADLFLSKIGFSDIQCLGESGDPDRDPNNHYILYRCETGKG